MEFEKAIEILETSTKVPDIFHTAEEIDQAIRLAIMALNQQDRWISIEDEEPTFNTWVLIVVDGDVFMGFVYNRCVCDYSKNGKWHEFRNITHWMPQPVPPNKENSND